MRLLAEQAIERASFAGAEVKVMALAALRSTREAEARSGWQKLPCIIGVPLPGERLGRREFDGRMEVAVFPGDLPEDPGGLLTLPTSSGPTAAADADRRFLKFRPPRISLEAPTGEAPALPHVRLDRAIEFLIGDRLV